MATDGNYWFNSVPALPSGSWYQVVYFNNENNWQYIKEWDAAPLDAYTAGSYAEVPTFNIGDVWLNLPWDERVSLPVTFAWQPRDCSAGDTFVWYLYDPQNPDTDYWELSSPTTGHMFTMTALPLEVSYNKQYFWGVRVEDPIAGRGWSLSEHSVVFLPPQ